VIYNESKDCVIVDAGNCNLREDNTLFDFIEKNQLKPIVILNTHAHFDHILGNYSVAKKYDIPLASHPDGYEYFKNAHSYALSFGMDYDKDKTLYPTIELYEGQIIKIGDDKLEVIHTPGHAKGCCCFYCEEQDFLITGDTLFCRGIGRTDLPGGSYSQIVESIKYKLYELPDETICYCGHGPETTIGDEKHFGCII
jgi:glyoxylase-like metal-dependent hydrolase (beta-lactamase superfamily II)